MTSYLQFKKRLKTMFVNPINREVTHVLYLIALLTLKIQTNTQSRFSLISFQ